jgi:NTE family protein
MNTDKRNPADAVFEGGGVKGIAFVGALAVMEKKWEWQRVGGTSAGAIVAAFTAANMSSNDIRLRLDKIRLTELMDTGWEDRADYLLSRLSPLRFVPRVGTLREHLLSVVKDFGIYEGDKFMEIVNANLPDGIRTFGNLLYDPSLPNDSPYRYKLRVVASDITAHRMLVLPQDIRYFGRNPDELPIAEALRMSMSIPFFFEPWKLKDSKGKVHCIVDGGILSNYPIWMFDPPIGENPSWPTFGFNLYDPADKADGEQPFPEDVEEVDNVFEFAKCIWDTLFSALDKRYIAQRHWARTIPIDNCRIPGTQFSLSDEEKERLLRSGEEGAQKFMAEWGDPEQGFATWKSRYSGEIEEAKRLAAQCHSAPPR